MTLHFNSHGNEKEFLLPLIKELIPKEISIITGNFAQINLEVKFHFVLASGQTANTGLPIRLVVDPKKASTRSNFFLKDDGSVRIIEGMNFFPVKTLQKVIIFCKNIDTFDFRFTFDIVFI